MISQAETAKTSKMVTLSMKINDFRSRKVAEICQKQSQKGENKDSIAYHEAKSF